ncbi:MAG: aryl-sulfate sulfotransferase [Candidatus Thorarchaeota archaeon]
MFPRIHLVIVISLLLWSSSGLETVPSPVISRNVSTDNQNHMISDWDRTVYVSGAEVNINKTQGAFEGYNLFILLKTNTTTFDRNFSMLIVDMDGQVVQEEPLGMDHWVSDSPAEFIDPTTILLRDQGGLSLYDLEDSTKLYLPFETHHELEYNPLNDSFFTLQYDEVTVDDNQYLNDQIVEYNRYGEIIWSLNTTSLIPYDQGCPYHDILLGIPDITHANTVFYDVEEDVIYLNLRNVNTFWKINHSNSEVIWSLGEYGDFTLYNQYGQQVNNLFYHAHAVERVDENTFILFDNDFHNQTDEWNEVSRIIEITIDDERMEAKITWAWTSDHDYYSFLWGDADRLPNGNRLGVFGFIYRADSPCGGRLVEVNEDKEIDWEMSFLNDEEYMYGIYRIERFRYSPIIHRVDTEDSNILKWQAWYNYRPKRDVNGSYEFYIDNNLIESGTITYDRYWRPSNLSITLPNLSPGIHNATLVVDDGHDHSTMQTVPIDVTNQPPVLLTTIFATVTIGLVALVIIVRYRLTAGTEQ